MLPTELGGTAGTKKELARKFSGPFGLSQMARRGWDRDLLLSSAPPSVFTGMPYGVYRKFTGFQKNPVTNPVSNHTHINSIGISRNIVWEGGGAGEGANYRRSLRAKRAPGYFVANFFENKNNLGDPAYPVIL